MSNIDKRATELLIENGELVADTLRHLADNEIDSDYFAICHTNENGTEIECELAITDYARQAAGTVDELVKALEAAEKRIAELEASTLTVKLQKHCGRDIAAFRVDPSEVSSWLTFRCEEDLRENGLIGANDSVVPLSVIAQETPKRGEVIVTVSGITGSCKSAIAGEIEIAMKAIGVPVQWANSDAEKRMTGPDWLTAIEMYKPSVRIVEVNVPRAAAGKGE